MNEPVGRMAVIDAGDAGESTFLTRFGELTGLPVVRLEMAG